MNRFLNKLSRRQGGSDSTNSLVEHTEQEESPDSEHLDRHLNLTALTCLSVSNSIGSGKT